MQRKNKKKANKIPPKFPGKIEFNASCVHAIPTSADPLATLAEPFPI